MTRTLLMTTLDVINPASGQRVARVPIDDPARFNRRITALMVEASERLAPPPS